MDNFLLLGVVVAASGYLWGGWSKTLLKEEVIEFHSWITFAFYAIALFALFFVVEELWYVAFFVAAILHAARFFPDVVTMQKVICVIFLLSVFALITVESQILILSASFLLNGLVAIGEKATKKK